MTDLVCRILTLVGPSAGGTGQAIRHAIATASSSLRDVEWFEVAETRGHVADGQVAHFQVTPKVGLRLDPDGDAD